MIKTLKGSLKGSRENIFDDLRKLEHKLVTDDLSKEQERVINIEIMTKKRIINEAESSENLEIKLAHA